MGGLYPNLGVVTWLDSSVLTEKKEIGEKTIL